MSDTVLSKHLVKRFFATLVHTSSNHRRMRDLFSYDMCYQLSLFISVRYDKDPRNDKGHALSCLFADFLIGVPRFELKLRELTRATRLADFDRLTCRVPDSTELQRCLPVERYPSR